MFKKKPISAIIVIAIIALLVAAIAHFSGGFPDKMAGNIFSPIFKVTSKIISPVTRFFDGDSLDKLQKENEELKLQLDELTIKYKSQEDYIKENERLKDLLNLKEAHYNKEIVTANVIALDWDNFSHTVTINRGSKDGIEVNDAVVSSLGVIGRVSEVSGYTSTVTTLLSPSHAVGVKISRTGDLAVCQGDITLSKDKMLRLDYISGSAELIEGDIIETSGVGGVYPEGLTIGKISKISKDSSGAVSYATVEPTANLSRLYEVLVITDWLREENAPQYVTDTENEAPDMTSELTDETIENAEG